MVCLTSWSRFCPRSKGLLRDLTAERLSVLQADLRNRGRAEATIAGHLAYLRAALAWAVDQGLLTSYRSSNALSVSNAAAGRTR